MRLRTALAIVISFAGCSIAWAEVPLPPDLSIQSLGQGVPAADAAFLGAWRMMQVAMVIATVVKWVPPR